MYSRNWLLLLDPHESWSANSGCPGGPTWDVLEHADSEEIQNHMKTFQAFKIQPSQAFDGTIIRIPLRTKAQAVKSKIVDREVTVHQISEALALLGHEVKQGGLLFLKHVRKMSVRIDDRVLWKVEMRGHDTPSTQARNDLSIGFEALFVPVVPIEKSSTISKTFQVDIRFTQTTLVTTISYLIHHLMKRSSGDPDLDSWARAKKLFSWVAIAAPIAGVTPLDSFKGRLFSILRLPIETSQPVHIHGLFSITPDRGRLSSTGQTPGYEDMETKWNDYMFESCVAEAWASLLVSRNENSWKEEGFGLWPRIESSPTTIWTRLDDIVLGRIFRDDLRVWNSARRCVSMTEGYFGPATGEIEKMYGPALTSIDLPAIYLPSSLFRKAKQLATQDMRTFRLISSSGVRRFLRDLGREYSPFEHSPMLLQYCLLDAIKNELSNAARPEVYREMNGLNLWPMADESLSPLDNECLLLPRDDEEMSLFAAARPNLTLDLGRLQTSVLTLIREDVSKGTLKAIRLRKLGDLPADWSVIYQLPVAHDPGRIFVPRQKGQDQLLTHMWTWISSRYKEEKAIPQVLQRLWLLPVSGYHVRQLMSEDHARPVLIVQKNEPLYRILNAVLDEKQVIGAQLLDCDIIPQAALKLLRAQVIAGSLRSAAASDHLETLLLWLVSNKVYFEGLSDKQNEGLLHEIGELVRKAKPLNGTPAWSEPLAKSIRQLPLFNRMGPTSSYKRWTLARTPINPQTIAVNAPKSLPCIQLPPTLTLFRFSSMAEKGLQKSLGLVQEIALSTLLFDYLIPFVFKAQDLDLEPVRYALAEFALDNSRSPSDAWVKSVNSEPIIPLGLRSDSQRREYRRLRDLVDPNSALAKLYFDDENVFPDRDFFRKHSPALTTCGINTKITWHTPLDRARFYATRTVLEQLLEKVKQLLSIPVDSRLFTNEAIVSEIRALQWLPVMPISDEQFKLFAPNECRGADERDIVDLVLGVLDIQVSSTWKRLFGWDQTISKEILHHQLDGCLVKERSAQIDHVLLYLYENCGSSSLQSKRCVLGSSGTYRYPHHSCLPGSILQRFALAPYLEEIDRKFASKHADLISDLDVLREPTFDDLLEIQKTLAGKNQGMLGGSEEMDIILSLLEIALRLPETAKDLTKIMIPDTEQILRSLPDIVFGDKSMAVNMPDLHFAHPTMSSKLIEGLRIESLFERATRLQIEIDDDDDDEYIPQERLTTIIADTLGRYPIDSTFGEFLANAEDCRASELAWILDVCKEGPHASTSLLTPEMTVLQGPSLFAWNDQGIFLTAMLK